MTKLELIEKLSNWPDDAQVEVSILTNDGDVVWYELTGVEALPNNAEGYSHCLLYTGNVTMA